jgi:hypothetical protein
MINSTFDQSDYDVFANDPRHVDIYYDSIPLTPELHKALMNGIVRVALDYDHVGTSKTGFVFRITGNLLSPLPPVQF